MTPYFPIAWVFFLQYFIFLSCAYVWISCRRYTFFKVKPDLYNVRRQVVAVSNSSSIFFYVYFLIYISCMTQRKSKENKYRRWINKSLFCCPRFIGLTGNNKPGNVKYVFSRESFSLWLYLPFPIDIVTFRPSIPECRRRYLTRDVVSRFLPSGL